MIQNHTFLVFGSSIAHRIVGNIFGSDSSKQNQTHSNQNQNKTEQIKPKEFIPHPICSELYDEYNRCINNINTGTNTDIQSYCKISYKMFRECEDSIKIFN